MKEGLGKLEIEGAYQEKLQKEFGFSGVNTAHICPSQAHTRGSFRTASLYAITSWSAGLVCSSLSSVLPYPGKMLFSSYLGQQSSFLTVLTWTTREAVGVGGQRRMEKTVLVREAHAEAYVLLAGLMHELCRKEN